VLRCARQTRGRWRSPPKPLQAPNALGPVPDIAGNRLESSVLEPMRPDWAGGLRETWTSGEASAQVQLKQFLKSGVERALAAYAKVRAG
jgi:deoxyribodipyrimidine photo-lyase